jgi:hypothetical protein
MVRDWVGDKNGIRGKDRIRSKFKVSGKVMDGVWGILKIKDISTLMVRDRVGLYICVIHELGVGVIFEL